MRRLFRNLISKEISISERLLVPRGRLKSKTIFQSPNQNEATLLTHRIEVAVKLNGTMKEATRVGTDQHGPQNRRNPSRRAQRILLSQGSLTKRVNDSDVNLK